MEFNYGENVHVIVGNELLNGWYNGKELGTSNSLVKVSRDKIISTKDCFIAKEKEPELVVVPQFVADWINYCEQRDYDLSCLLDYDDSGMSYEIDKWLRSKDSNQELLARAWLDGYEVEKEPLYYVMLPYLDAEKEINYAYILVNITDNKTQPSLSNCISREWKAELTEAEIKGMPAGDIYWQFAVLVEEAEGEDNE
ncbi:DUF1642 domain-containing protein [Listeria monocytogenes]|uniref:DUF1642 domain-containing protein n=1 Tax=Listeria monocytogenes TaxID=1639 RepID=UPI0004DAAE3F|nr:DUF1642 domain-containing protein [Listeria monocytogenes]EAA0052049.1 DUF1642 domain-containing protein [Listeria monocytogenes]EAC6138373.1 DUF1642 domain-containing protein [Listeria monocytogenes]EAC9146039.1 DUF1642 domain-containing protein [Listeria monocytogenes]EAD3342398.1 DUF1642 domain-containing protein [Listeria monocytogenes]EAD3365104.1 DUF1642 domain-containing protein [Listeria monocytogenes]